VTQGFYAVAVLGNGLWTAQGQASIYRLALLARVGHLNECEVKMEQAHRPKPVLLAVDDDADDRAKIEHELYDRYGRSYRIVCEASAEAGMSTLETLRTAGEEVAVVLADLWMPKMPGPEFLAHGLDRCP
jgi:PleD family two-component response regulator